MNPKFSKGEIVKLVNTDKVGVICGEPKEIAGETHYVLFLDNSQKTYSEDSLEPAKIKNKDLATQFKETEYSSLTEFNNYLTFLKIERPLSNNLYSFLSSRTEFLIHQFKPVIKFLKSPYQRLFIADEVGVGKTIEAGIIYTELLSRFDMKNVLFICPSSLCYKWQKELRKRFSEDFGILDSKSLKLFFKKFERNPQGVQLKAIASIQMLRNEDLLNQFEKLQIPWDFILIDEAHHMRNESTRSNKLGRIMSNTAESMIMMSATPLQLGNRDLFNLFRILMPEEFNNFDNFEDQIKPNEFINLAVNKISKRDSAKKILEQLTKVEQTSQKERFLSNPNYQEAKRILSKSELTRSDIITLQKILSELNILANIYTRTKKKEISVDSPIREPVTIKVEFTPEEFNYYKLVEDLFLKLNPGAPPGFILQMPLRQVASCIPASIDYLKDICAVEEINLTREDIDEEEEAEKVLLSRSDVNSIKSLISYAEEKLVVPDSKSVVFIKTIDKILNQKGIKKIIVFSFFKRTLRFLKKELKKKGFKVAKIDGDVPFAEREIIFEKFADPNGYQILLSSEVGGEGLDMQFCNCMINYDLPWNPMKVEQRIGRLDRYGQKNPKIHIYNFSVENTIESNIFLRLCNRIGVFEQYVGELEPILGDAIKKLTSEIVNTDLTSEQQKQKADQIALVIEKKKKDLEIFDKDRKKFIGQDNYFTEEISNIQKQERFITPKEIMNLVLMFLEENFSKTKVLKESSELSLRIKPDDNFREFVRNNIFTQKEVSTEFTEKFLNLINQDSFRITFDYKIANAKPNIEFITLRHNLIKSIVSFYKKKNFNMLTLASWNDSDLNISGNFIFFIYLLEIKGYSNSLTFIPVVIDCKTNQLNKELSENLFKVLKNSKDNPDTSNYPCESFEDLQAISLQYVIEQKKIKKKELETINESLVNDMISSLEQSYKIKITNIDNLIERMKNNLNEKTEKIIKMKKSQRVNVTKNFESKKTEFESKRKIIVSHELIAGGFLNVN